MSRVSAKILLSVVSHIYTLGADALTTARQLKAVDVYCHLITLLLLLHASSEDTSGHGIPGEVCT